MSAAIVGGRRWSRARISATASRSARFIPPTVRSRATAVRADGSRPSASNPSASGPFASGSFAPAASPSAASSPAVSSPDCGTVRATRTVPGFKGASSRTVKSGVSPPSAPDRVTLEGAASAAPGGAIQYQFAGFAAQLAANSTIANAPTIVSIRR